MKNTLFVVAAILVGAFIILATDNVQPFGDPGRAPMDDYFIENTLQERSSKNIVTAVVFDFRAFDTIGEAAVLFTALCAITVFFREGRKKP